jgi:uncharacterized CHY-type Zn-finger protein
MECAYIKLGELKMETKILCGICNVEMIETQFENGKKYTCPICQKEIIETESKF